MMVQVREYHSREKKHSWPYRDSGSKRFTWPALEESTFLVHVDGVQANLHNPGSVPRILAKIPALLSRMQWPKSMLCSTTADYFWWYKSASKCMAQAVRHTTPCTLHMVVDGPYHPSCDKKGGDLPGRKHPGLMLCLDSTLLIRWSVTDEKPEAHYHGDTSW
jgi:hypothetical protein